MEDYDKSVKCFYYMFRVQHIICIRLRAVVLRGVRELGI
jgi:hypothetical protein